MKTYIRWTILIALIMTLFSMINQIIQSAYASGFWYVTTSGDDNNNCLSPTTPCATINGTLNKPGFVPGDTIQVAIGTYTGLNNGGILIDKNASLSGGWDESFIIQSGKSILNG